MSKFFGWLLIVIGVLVAGTAGLCSAAILQPMVHEAGGANASGVQGVLAMVAVFGGVPFVFGVACIIAGWVIRKGKKPTT